MNGVAGIEMVMNRIAHELNMDPWEVFDVEWNSSGGVMATTGWLGIGQPADHPREGLDLRRRFEREGLGVADPAKRVGGKGFDHGGAF